MTRKQTIDYILRNAGITGERPMVTHYVPMFTMQRGDRQVAFCGAHVLPGSHSNEPSCGFCQAILEADAQSLKDLNALRDEAWDPRAIVRIELFDSTKDGAPKGTAAVCPRCQQAPNACLCAVDRHWSERR